MSPVFSEPETPLPRNKSKTGRRQVLAYILMTPALALSLVFFLVPLVLMIFMSFTNWPLFGEPRPVGVDNFTRAFTDPAFMSAIWFSLKYALVLVPLSFIVSYGAAVMVRGQGRFTSFVRTSLFTPVVVGFTAAAYMASVLLMPNTGFISAILRGLHISDGRTTWFNDPDRAFWAVVILTIWKTMGVAMILLMAGMQSVPGEVLEAAVIDGAGWWRRELSVVLPLIKRQIALCLIMSVSGTLLVFDQFYVLTKGGPSGQTTTAVMYIYQQSFVRYNLGYGAALSAVVTVVILILAVMQLRGFRADTGEER